MQLALWIYAAITVATVLAVVFVDAPYGRHARAGWGPSIPARAGWIGMELPSVVAAALTFSLGAHSAETVPRVLLAVWMLHYVQRTLIYPFLLRGQGKTMPLSIAAMAFLFTSFNGWINFHHVAHVGAYAPSWLVDPRFLGGLALFLAGFAINLKSDAILRALRQPGESGYKVPRGFLFRWISCPNYLGEMMEWFGWALMTWSLPGLLFALYTVANLGPRALANHRWNQEHLPGYPAERRALIPGLL